MDYAAALIGYFFLLLIHAKSKCPEIHAMNPLQILHQLLIIFEEYLADIDCQKFWLGILHLFLSQKNLYIFALGMVFGKNL